jgi:hypothetical protein
MIFPTVGGVGPHPTVGNGGAIPKEQFLPGFVVLKTVSAEPALSNPSANSKIPLPIKK